MQRRSFLLALAGTWAGRRRLVAGQAAQVDLGGCAWQRGAGAVQSDTTSRSGNAELDKALIAEVRKLDEVLGINPGYRFLNDGARPNAYATPQTHVQGTSGTVLFGLTLLQQELRTEYGGAAIAGIAAHEGAHILQFNHNLRRRIGGSTAKPMELPADFMAGYYFSRTGRTERSLIVFAESLFSKGDYEYNNPDHHGTPQQRVTAMRTGYGAGASDLTTAIEQGVQHVATR